MTKGFTHLTRGERERIRTLRVQKKSIGFIAEALSRAKSTIHAEINNHLHHGAYEPDRADATARVKRKKPRRQRKMMLPEIESFVKEGLRQKWSPEQISGRMLLEYPSSLNMRISHQTIYTWLHRDKKLGGKWYTALRRKTRKYKKLGRRRIYSDNRKSIEARPKAVEQRRFYGDWEADTVDGKLYRGHLATLVEGKSLYTVIAKMARKNAAAFNSAMVGRMRRSTWLPMRTLTVDNGPEFARHEELSIALGADVYFAQPQCAWQRGLNENTNGLLRQYFPRRKTDFLQISEDLIEQIEAALNNRPRKKLGYRTPLEAMTKYRAYTRVRIRT